MSRKLLCFFIALFICCKTLYAENLPDISADGAILIDSKTNTILYAKNMSLAFYPASTTKILTSLAILQDMALDEIVTKTQDAVNNVPSDSSQIGLNVGDQYTVWDGLHAVLMASDNFVCYDLAEQDAGSIPLFADAMNQLALIAGANRSHFVNPHGYHDSDHYTSPYSLAKIAQTAFGNPTLEEIAGTYRYTFQLANANKTIPLTHTAALLNPDSPYYNPHVTAAKTGFHDEAGRTLVAKAKYGEMELIGVIMRTSAPHQFEDMNKLFTYGADNFSYAPSASSQFSLVNHTYSAWAKPYVTEALTAGWITNTAHNYMTPVTRREFLGLLRSISPTDLTERVSQMIHYDGASIFTENKQITRGELAQLITYYLEPLDLIPLNKVPTITDISQLSSTRQQAIIFSIQAGILNIQEDQFHPDGIVTYEQALSIISRLNGILQRYQSYSL